jgi:hypothetical protein
MNPINKVAKQIGQEVGEQLGKKAAPIVEKAASAAKKPLKWGFKGRKETDIQDLDYDSLERSINFGTLSKKNERIIANEYDKLLKGSKKNEVIKKYLDDTAPVRIPGNYFPVPMDQSLARLNSNMYKVIKLKTINDYFRGLELRDVPRELTGKLLGSKYNRPYFDLFVPPSEKPKHTQKVIDTWRKKWLSYYNDLTPVQKETFDALESGWEGTMSELLEAVKRLA